MTVLRVNPADEYDVSRGGTGRTGPGRRSTQPVPPSRQVQNWARGLEVSSGRQHRVISEKRISLPAFSADGIRWDVLTVVLALVLLLFAGILISDMGALIAGGERIGKLSAGIESLEGSNSLLRNELTAALNHPVLLGSAAGPETLNETVVVLSPPPVE